MRGNKCLRDILGGHESAISLLIMLSLWLQSCVKGEQEKKRRRREEFKDNNMESMSGVCFLVIF